jgi:hypothetical protein
MIKKIKKSIDNKIIKCYNNIVIKEREGDYNG